MKLNASLPLVIASLMLCACVTSADQAADLSASANAVTNGDSITAPSTSDGDIVTAVSDTESGETVITTALLEDDPIICKKVTQPGTRFKREVCQRRSARDEIKRQSRNGLEDLQRGSTTIPLPGG